MPEGGNHIYTKSVSWGEGDRYSCWVHANLRTGRVTVSLEDAWQSPGDAPCVPMDSETAKKVADAIITSCNYVELRQQALENIEARNEI